MKKTFALLIIITILLSACQPTPEELIVQQKDKEEFNEALQQTAALPMPTNTSSGIDTDKNMVVLEHWTETTENSTGTSILNIDADVIMPASGQIPVVEISTREFTCKQLNGIAKTFVGDNLLYSEAASSILTKQEIEDAIIKTQKDMKDLNSDMAQSAGITSLDELEKIGEKQIADLQTQYKNAPEDKSTVITKQFNIDELISSTSEEVILNIGGHKIDFGDEGTGYLSIGTPFSGRWNIEFESPRAYNKNYELRTEFLSDADMEKYRGDVISAPRIEMDENSAKVKIYELLDDLGIDDMEIYQMKRGRLVEVNQAGDIFSELECYEAIIYKCINSVYIPLITGYQGKESESMVAPDIPVEQIKVYIDEKGVIKFLWMEPTDIVEIVNQNVAMLDFEAIKQMFIQQFFNVYSYKASEDIAYFKYNIDKIELSLAMLVKPDNIEEYIAIPTWDFYGEKLTKYTGETLENTKVIMQEMNKKPGSLADTKKISLNEKDELVERLPYTYMTINATTGAIINRYMGY